MGLYAGSQAIRKIYAGSRLAKRMYEGQASVFVRDSVTADIHPRRLSEYTIDATRRRVGRDVRYGQGDARDLSPLFMGELNILGVTYDVSGENAGRIEVHMSQYPVAFELVFTDTGSGASYRLSLLEVGFGLTFNLAEQVFVFSETEGNPAKKAILDDIFGDIQYRANQKIRLDLMA